MGRQVVNCEQFWAGGGLAKIDVYGRDVVAALLKIVGTGGGIHATAQE